LRSWQIRVTVTPTNGPAPPYTMAFDHQPIAVGAAMENDVVIEGPRIADRHAQVTMSRGVLTVLNQSHHGTFVANQRIERHVLGAGEVVHIPPFELRFELLVAASPESDGDQTVREAPPAADGTVILGRPPRGSRPLFIEVIQGPPAVKGKRLSIPADGLRIGRSPDADFSVDVPTLSRLHAEIRPTPNGDWLLRDLRSANGTFLNGSRVSEHRVRAGDELILADDVVLRVVDDTQPDAPVARKPAPAARDRANQPVDPTPSFASPGGKIRTIAPIDKHPTLQQESEEEKDSSAADTAPRRPLSSGASARTFTIHSTRAEWNKQVLILGVQGRVDGYNYSELGLALDGIADDGERNVLIDLSGVSYIDHTGLGVLMKALTVMNRYGGKIVLIGASQRLLDAISLSRLDSYLKVFPDEQAARKEFKKAR
jgi:anti-anti-sigma factor